MVTIILGDNKYKNNVAKTFINENRTTLEVKHFNDINMDFIKEMVKNTNGYEDFLTPVGKQFTERNCLDMKLSEYQNLLLLKKDEMIEQPIIIKDGQYHFGCGRDTIKQLFGV